MTCSLSFQFKRGVEGEDRTRLLHRKSDYSLRSKWCGEFPTWTSRSLSECEFKFDDRELAKKSTWLPRGVNYRLGSFDRPAPCAKLLRRNSCRSRTQRTQPAALPAKQPAAELGPSIRRQGRKSDSIVRPCPVQPVCGKEQIVPGRTSPGTLRMQPAVQPGTRKSGPCKRILDVKIYIKVLTFR